MSHTPDLRLLFPDYRVRTTSDHVKGTRILPENLEIPGRYGTVYVFPDSARVYACTRAPRVAAQLRRTETVTVHQDGDHEVCCHFRPEDAAPVLALLRCYRKRQLREQQVAA